MQVNQTVAIRLLTDRVTPYTHLKFKISLSLCIPRRKTVCDALVRMKMKDDRASYSISTKYAFAQVDLSMRASHSSFLYAILQCVLSEVLVH